MKAEFVPNQCLTLVKTTSQHNELKAKLQLAKKTNVLHLSSLNLDVIFPEVFTLTNLVRLDLSFNNLVQIPTTIGELTNLQILWLNDNPLRELPIELANCKKLKEVDLKNTFIITLPRELASLAHLVFLNLENCPLKETLAQTYESGMATMHKTLRAKDDRRVYKTKLMNKLCEWIYPSVDKAMLGEAVEQIFEQLKGCDSAMLKKLYRDCQQIFPIKFEQIDPLMIKNKLEKVFEETKEREEIAQLELQIRAHFATVPLKEVVRLSADIYRKNMTDMLKEFLKNKEKVFAGDFDKLTADILKLNLESYKKSKVEERLNGIKKLKKKIAHLYADEKLEDETIEKYNQEIVAILKKTERILEFTKHYREFMPKGHELKYFDANKIVSGFNEKYPEIVQEMSETAQGKTKTKSLGKSTATMKFGKK